MEQEEEIMKSGARKLTFAAALVLTLCGASFAESNDWRWQRGDGDHDRDDGYYRQNRDSRDNQRSYQDGFRDGQNDRAHNRGFQIRNRHWNDRNDRDAYASGYRNGYGQGNYGNGYPGRGGYGYPGQGGYGYPGGNNGRGGGWYGGSQGQGQAYNIGYQDGLRHGSQDRNTGHSFRPTHDDDFRNADRGYNSSFGNKQDYKNQYRNGYQNGYNRGYNGR
jgi:hypothetical protein